MNNFTAMLNSWEAKSQQAADRAQVSLSLHKHDLVKIKALAEAYGLDEATITESLIHTAIKEAESAMPYVKGTRVIRVEEGEEVFADAGKTPTYVEAEQKINQSMLTT